MVIRLCRIGPQHDLGLIVMSYLVIVIYVSRNGLFLIVFIAILCKYSVLLLIYGLLAFN